MAAKPPDAFLSYTRFDDRRGDISAFCRHLEEAVREVTGESFEIFQDVDDIEIGERWSDKLDEMLAEARFFIPILTPSYFNSTACRDELQKFLKAEERVGRLDLILPIYYIRCPVLEDTERRRADDLATTIHLRQRWDWRELRHYSLRHRNVRLKITALGEAIAAARHTRAAAPAVKPGAVDEEKPAPPPDREARTLGEGTLSPGTVFRDKDEPWCPEMVVIPPGEFMMGSTAAEREWAIGQGTWREWLEAEQPQHPVRIAYPLAVGRYPVTFEEYGHFARSARHAQPDDAGWGRGRRPVINVSWEDSKAYVEWLSAGTGQVYRLLSEAEWEYACRASTTTRYWWGDEITPENANYGRKVGKTGEVGSYLANSFGLYDTHGNVWEWVEDRWQDSYGDAPDDGSAWIVGTDSRRVQRGGSWANGPGSIRSACRGRNITDSRGVIIGFRVARTLSHSESDTS
jgi:formylglycine-generating enzyme required for sulfatase activity